MKIFRYRVQPIPGQSDEIHFELRLSDFERPIHVALRGHNNTVVVNHMVDGVWGDEKATESKVPIAKIRVFYLEIVSDTARIFFDGQEIRFKMRFSHDEVTLFGAAKNASFNQYIETKDVPTKPEKQGIMVDWLRGKSPEEVRFIGRNLKLGPSSDMWLANELIISPGLEVNDAYMSFLSTRPLARSGMKLTILDLSSTAVANALKAAILLPDAEVLVASGDSARDRFIGDLVKRNDIKNLKTATLNTMVNHFKGTNGAVLVQGPGVFATFGVDIDKMTAEKRANLSIFTHEAKPVRGDRVFPCANASIQAGSQWCLNFNSGLHPKARRHGLDVAVAAYNAKEHLIECASSLLCEGRDDVRVIIVDDGSTDGSGEMAARHFRRDPRVRVERKPNGGCASARNYGRLVSGVCQRSCPPISCGVSDFRGARFVFGVEPDGPCRLPVAGFA
nr:glycosyltransferase [Paracoccus sp. (in: a-proteobacteria)]